MMRKSRKERLVAEINITPFTDVILVLLVIFMITTPLISKNTIKVNLPEAANADQEGGTRRNAQATITITTEGTVYLEQKLVSRKELREQLGILQRTDPGLNIVLRSDKLVRFKDIVAVLDTLSELGITKLAIAATIK